MRYILIVLLSFTLFACSSGDEQREDAPTVEEPESTETPETDTVETDEAVIDKDRLTSSYLLEIAPGYEAPADAPRLLIIDPIKKEMHVSGETGISLDNEDDLPETLTAQDLTDLTEAEAEGVRGLIDIIEYYEVTDNQIIIGYQGKTREFTARSASYFELEDGAQYILEPNVSLDEFIQNIVESSRP